MISFLIICIKVAKEKSIKICTFGTNKKSDICLKKIIKKGNTSKIIISINNKSTDLKIGDLNVNNVYLNCSLRELKIDISKKKIIIKI